MLQNLTLAVVAFGFFLLAALAIKNAIDTTKSDKQMKNAWFALDCDYNMLKNFAIAVMIVGFLSVLLMMFQTLTDDKKETKGN